MTEETFYRVEGEKVLVTGSTESKIAKFSHPVYLTAQLKGFPLEMGTDARSQKTRMRLKGFKIGLAV